MTSTTQTPGTVDAATVLHWAREPDDLSVIDVRTPAEFETAHIAGSCNVPLNLLAEHASHIAARLDRKVVLVCQSGARASQARQRLAGVGGQDLHILQGESAPTTQRADRSYAAAHAGPWTVRSG